MNLSQSATASYILSRVAEGSIGVASRLHDAPWMVKKETSIITSASYVISKQDKCIPKIFKDIQ